MATIPRLVAERSLERGSVVQYPTDDPVGRAVEGFGGKMVSEASRLMEQQRQQERLQALVGMNTLDAQMDGELQRQAQEGKTPGAYGLATEVGKTWDQKAQEFISTQPQHLQPELRSRLELARQRFANQAATVEYSQGKAYETSLVEQRAQAGQQAILQQGEGALPAFIKDGDEIIDNSSRLTALEKQEAKRRLRATLEETAVRSMIASDPAKAAEVISGWGVGRGGQVARERSALTFFVQKGLSPVAAAAVVGRLGHESGMRTDARNPGDGSDGSDSIGLGQWNSGRADALKRFAAQQGKPWTDAGVQLEFVWRELNGSERKALGMLQSARTPEQAARAMVEFERPKGWRADGAYRNEDVSGWSDQLARARRLMGEHVEPGDAGGVRSVPVADPRFNDIPADRRLILAGLVDQTIRQQAAQASAAATAEYNGRYNQLQLDILDGKATMADVAVARQQGWLTDADHINKLANAIQSRDKDLEDTRNFHQAWNDPAHPWNPLNNEQKKQVDKGWRSMGGDLSNLEAVVERTKILPSSAATALRGALISNDPQKVMGAATIARNLLANNQNIFTGVEGGSDLETAAVDFRRYTERLGLTEQQAAQRIIKEQAPDHKADLQRRMKAEDVDGVIRKEVTSGALMRDMEKAFNEGLPYFGRPGIEFDPQTRQGALADFADLVRSEYLQHGDMAKAKDQAALQLKKIWGVTFVTGGWEGVRGGRVMRFPPEKAIANQGVENVGDEFATQILAKIKTDTGKDIDRKSLVVEPTEDGRTAQAYWSGAPVPYRVRWTDEKGVTHIAQVPLAFNAEGVRARQAEARRQAFEAARAGDGNPEGRMVRPGSPLDWLTGGSAQAAQPGAAAPAPRPGPEPAERPLFAPGSFMGALVNPGPGKPPNPADATREPILPVDPFRPGDRTLGR
jgi:hypothetical protein